MCSALITSLLMSALPIHSWTPVILHKEGSTREPWHTHNAAQHWVNAQASCVATLGPLSSWRQRPARRCSGARCSPTRSRGAVWPPAAWFFGQRSRRALVLCAINSLGFQPKGGHQFPSSYGKTFLTVSHLTAVRFATRQGLANSPGSSCSF